MVSVVWWRTLPFVLKHGLALQERAHKTNKPEMTLLLQKKQTNKKKQYNRNAKNNVASLLPNCWVSYIMWFLYFWWALSQWFPHSNPQKCARQHFLILKPNVAFQYISNRRGNFIHIAATQKLIYNFPWFGDKCFVQQHGLTSLILFLGAFPHTSNQLANSLPNGCVQCVMWFLHFWRALSQWFHHSMPQKCCCKHFLTLKSNIPTN